MADLEEALTTYLLAQSGLTSLISRKLYPEEMPQGTVLPAVTHIGISDIKLHTLTGQLKIERPVLQYTAYAYTKAEAKAVAEQLKTALSDYQGTLSGVVIQKIELQNEITNMETSSDGTVKVYTKDLEFEITYEKE